MTRTDVACCALIALAVGLVLCACVGWRQEVWCYAERLEEVEEIEPERVEQ